MSKKITLALIGRGHWGKIYEKTISKMDGVILPKQNVYGKDYRNIGVNTYRIDGVIVASSTSFHFEIASYLLKNGFKKMLIEKPLTQTYQQAKRLQELLQAVPDSCVLVGHTLLYDPAYNKMKKIAQAELGKILQINYSSLKTPPIRNATVLQDAGSPPIYLFLDFVGKNPTKVSAKPKEDDNIELRLVFNDGLIAVANIGSIHPVRKREIEIIGKKGILKLNEFVSPRDLILTENNNKRKYLTFPRKKTALELEIEEFIKCPNHRKKPRTPYYSGINVIRIIELAEKSLARKGQTLPFDNN